MRRISVLRRVSSGLLLAAVAALVPTQTVLAQAPTGDSDARLAAKVNYTSNQASVQDIVQNLAQQAGLEYDRQQSFKQTDPLCRRWVRNLAIKDKPCREALDQILKPVGLKYQVENGVVVLSRVTASTPPPATGPDPPKLAAARKALTGPNKDVATAKELLLELVGKERATLPPGYLCYAYVYLGYIEDRAGKRKEAVDWYMQAQAMGEADEGIRECAASGLKEPLTWIRHLDQGTSPAQPAPSGQTRPPGKGYITTGEPPADLVPAETLSPKQQRENFDFLCKAIDETYADFEIKGINWSDIQRRYEKRLDASLGADEFYRLIFQLVGELKDTHSWLQNYHPPDPACGPGLTLDLSQGRPFVVAVYSGSEAEKLGVKPGAEVLELDGVAVANKMEQLRPRLRGCSSERGFQREACRLLLAAEDESTMALKLRTPGGGTETFSLKRTLGVGWPGSRPPPFELTRQRFVHYGRHPSGLGYIRIDSFLARAELDEEFDRALEAVCATPGLILDIRYNPGGYGHPHMVGRLLQKQALGAISYVKNGPGHSDLARRDDLLGPAGEWQYAGPVALLVNDVTGSAADLFACYLRSAGRVVTVGSTTHGNLAGVAAYAVLPCGLIVRISNGYICDATGKPIEGRGNEPDVTVTPTINDLLAGKDPVLASSVRVLREKLSHN
jgi:C-terminal processing protease CtpA/Prc